MSSEVAKSVTKKAKKGKNKHSVSKTNPLKDTLKQNNQEANLPQPEPNLNSKFQEDEGVRTTITSHIKKPKKKKVMKSRDQTPSTIYKESEVTSDKGFLTPAKESPSKRHVSTRSPSPTYKQSLSYAEIRKGQGVNILKMKERVLKSEDEDDEARNSIIIIKRQEIEAKILDSQEDLDSDDEKKLVRKEIKNEKFFDLAYTDLHEKIHREASPVREEVSKAKKPKFKLEPGKQYLEKQVVRTHATEIIPRKKLHLIPLLERDEHILSTEVDRSLFNDDERKIVASRRKEYSNRGRGVIREIIMTEILKKKLDATILIQRWFRRYSRMAKMRRATLVHKENVIDTKQLAEEVKKLAEEEKENEKEEELKKQRLEELRTMQEAEILRKIDFNDSKKRYSVMDPSLKAMMNGRRASGLVPIWARETKASESKRIAEEKKEDEPLFKLKSQTHTPKRNSVRNSVLLSDTKSNISSRVGTHTSEETSNELKARVQERRASEMLPIWAKDTKASATKRSTQVVDHLPVTFLHEESPPKASLFKKNRKSKSSAKSDEHEGSSEEEFDPSHEAEKGPSKKSSSPVKKSIFAEQSQEPYVSVHNDHSDEGGVIYKKKQRESKITASALHSMGKPDEEPIKEEKEEDSNTNKSEESDTDSQNSAMKIQKRIAADYLEELNKTAMTRFLSEKAVAEPYKPVEKNNEVETLSENSIKQSLIASEPRKSEALIPISAYYARKESLPSSARSQEAQRQTTTEIEPISKPIEVQQLTQSEKKSHRSTVYESGYPKAKQYLNEVRRSSDQPTIAVDSISKTIENQRLPEYEKKSDLTSAQKAFESKPQQYSNEVRRSSAQEKGEGSNNSGTKPRASGVTEHILATLPLSERIKQAQMALLKKSSGSKRKASYIPDYKEITSVNYLNKERASTYGYTSPSKTKDNAKFNQPSQNSSKVLPKSTPKTLPNTSTQRNQYLPSSFREIKRSLPQVDVLLSATRELENTAAIIIQRHFRAHLVDIYRKSNTIDMIQKDFSDFLKGVRSDHDFSFKPAMQALALSYIKKKKTKKH